MSKVKTRKNKNYTSIILQEISETAFIEARKKQDELMNQNSLTRITISDKAWKEFFSLHTVDLSELAIGDEYKLLGTAFTVTKRDEHGLTYFKYYTRNVFDDQLEQKMDMKVEECGGLGNAARSWIEQCFKNTTGTLLFG